LIRALLVDDESAFVRTTRRLLERATGQPRVRLDDCRTGRAALGRLQNRYYDAVLLDWMLDGEDGLEFGSRIRELPKGRHVALIMVTGRRVATESEWLALRAGFDDFVRKPFDPEILRLRLAAAVERASLRSRGGAGRATPPGRTAWTELADGALEILFDEAVAIVRSRWVELKDLEWKLARTLYARRGQVVDRPTCVRETWGPTPPANPRDSLDHLLSALKRKLGSSRGLLETVSGEGIRLRFGPGRRRSPTRLCNSKP
jgi:DNA-binding response OmpR family regulator